MHTHTLCNKHTIYSFHPIYINMRFRPSKINIFTLPAALTHRRIDKQKVISLEWYEKEEERERVVCQLFCPTHPLPHIFIWIYSVKQLFLGRMIAILVLEDWEHIHNEFRASSIYAHPYTVCEYRSVKDIATQTCSMFTGNSEHSHC